MDRAARVYTCSNPEHSSYFLNELNKQRLKGIHCDVTVKVQGAEFKSHANVLSASLGYFKDILNKTQMTSLPITIDIPDIVNPTGFSKVLDYIYTSNLSLSQNTVMETLCTACFLQSPFVYQKCQEFLQTHGFTGGSPDMKPNNIWMNNLSKLTAKMQKPSVPYNPRSHNSDLIVFDGQGKSTIINHGALTSQIAISQNDTNRGTPFTHNRVTPSNGINEYPNGRWYTANKDNVEKFADKLAAMKKERLHESLSKKDEEKPPVMQPKINLNYPRKTDSFETATIDHQSLADYFSSKRKQQHVINADQNHQIHHSIKLLNGPPKTPESGVALSLVKNNGSEQGQKKEGRLEEQNDFSFINKKEKPKKEFKCEYCNKVFGRQQHLKRHILTHTGERPYPCTLCDKRFRRSEHLKHHLASHDADPEAVQRNMMQSRKRAARKPEEDAYSLSKMMLNYMKNSQQQFQPNNDAIKAFNGGYNGNQQASIMSNFAFNDQKRGEDYSKPSEPAAVGSPINLKINGSKKVKLEASQSGYQENDDRKNMLSLLKKSNNAESNFDDSGMSDGNTPSPSSQQVKVEAECNRETEEHKDIEPLKINNSTKSNSPAPLSLDEGSNCDVTERCSEAELMSLDKSEMMSEDLKRLMKSLSD